MKQHSTLLLALVMTAASCTKKADNIVQKASVNHDVAFNIGRLIDYSLPQYQGFQAEVKLYLFYVNNQTFEQTPVWDTTLTLRPVLNYPAFAQPLQVLQKITNPSFDRQELHVSYNIAFYRNNIIQYQSGFSEVVRPVNAAKSIDVKL
jgi:hypothetical protein